MLSQRDLIKILQLVAEINTNIYHNFSLVAVKRKDGRYLQRYDKDWKCWLFPYYRTTDNNKADIEKQVKNELGIECSISYIAVAEHCKYSVRDEVYKRYKHKLYKIELTDVPEHMMESMFESSAIQYKWMTIEEMEENKEIMEKNDDVVAFIKSIDN